MDHGKNVRDGDMDLLARTGLSANANRGSTEERTNVVRLLNARFGVPDNIVAVGEDGRAEGGTVVAANTDHHQSREANIASKVETESKKKVMLTQSFPESAWFGIHIPGWSG